MPEAGDGAFVVASNDANLYWVAEDRRGLRVLGHLCRLILGSDDRVILFIFEEMMRSKQSDVNYSFRLDLVANHGSVRYGQVSI